jgi:hypothetical protein
VSETRDTDTLRDAGVPHALHPRQIEKAVRHAAVRPQGVRGVHVGVWLEERVEYTPEGTTAQKMRAMDASARSRGTRVTRGSSRAGRPAADLPPRLRTSASCHLAPRSSRLATCFHELTRQDSERPSRAGFAPISARIWSAFPF